MFLQAGDRAMQEFDITRTNEAVERLISVTDNPRHRFLLEAYNRHRNLEMAGRYEEIFTPEMTVEHPVYRFSLIGQPVLKLDGRDQIEPLYHHWTETDQCVFYNEGERVAVGDYMVVSRTTGYQQTLGAELREPAADVDPGAMYLVKAQVVMVWPYDSRGRLVGEDVWEYDDAEREVIKLDPADVLTAERAGELLEPLIRPLPRFDSSMAAVA